ncbi:MAG: hypothetical protein WCF22_24910 [Candidatus Sulfotelmatobacter sp.]
MTYLHKNRTGRSQSTQYATSEDFCQLFGDRLNELYVLSFLITGDHELAERCFVAGLEETIESNYVLSESARSWAKRKIVESAIDALQPSARYSHAAAACGKPELLPSADCELYRVLMLEKFERLVFVMSVLERYSDRDCALLLGCSLQEVREARNRALERIGNLNPPEVSHNIRTRHELHRALALNMLNN